MTTETVGYRVIRLAAAAGFPADRRALCRSLGITYETLRKWMRGTTAPNRNRAIGLSQQLGVPVEVIMHGVGAGDVGLSARGSKPTQVLASAIDVLEAAVAAVPETKRHELGDLIRQWVIYGASQLYRAPMAALLGVTDGDSHVTSAARPVSAEARHIAIMYDMILGEPGRASVVAAAQAALQQEYDAMQPAPPAPDAAPMPPPPVTGPAAAKPASRRRRAPK
jgi:transcriptional regulator with XRE-family HTH domain